MAKSGFSITERKLKDGEILGFKIIFDNGYGISMSFGSLTQSDEVEFTDSDSGKTWFSPNAQIFVVNDKGLTVPFQNETITEGVVPSDLAQIIAWVMKR